MVATVQVQPLPPVPSAQNVTQNDYITQPWNQWFIQFRDKVNTINATIAQIAGNTPSQNFDYLSPLTTAGDLLTYSGGHNVRFPIGANGDVLTVVSGVVSWQPPSGGTGGVLPVVNGDIPPVLVYLEDGSLTYYTV